MSLLSFGFQNPLKLNFGDEFFQNLPTEPGVYFFLDDDRQPLYIGKADSLKKRLASYKLAKPGGAPEHILEMIEHVREINWEVHADSTAALRREAELIRTLKPPFNIAGTDPIPFLFLGLRAGPVDAAGRLPLDYRLTHREVPEGFTPYGCYLHRGKTKAGYAALLRLFFAATCTRERYNLPAKICRTSPPYSHRAEIPAEWLKPLQNFLSGHNADLLKLIFARLLEKENLPPHQYAPLQRDLQMAKEFYLAGPSATRKILVSAGRPRGRFLAQKQMERLADDHHRKFLRDLPGRAERSRPVITVSGA